MSKWVLRIGIACLAASVLLYLALKTFGSEPDDRLRIAGHTLTGVVPISMALAGVAVVFIVASSVIDRITISDHSHH